MKVISPDKGQLEIEEKEAERLRKEQDDKARYLENLKKNRRFQKYVVEGIFQKVLDEVYTLDNVPMGDDEKVMGATVKQFKLARAGFLKVINKLK